MRLRELRLERKLTQTQVGAVLGKSAPTVYRLENGLSPLLLTDAQKLAAFFGLSIQEFLEGPAAPNGHAAPAPRRGRRASRAPH
jgi:transcriptional regulator with XRE-family HTH domain